MVLLAAAAIASAPPQAPQSHPFGASVQARATIRIISGAELHFGRVPAAGSFAVHDSTIRSADGEQPAKLIEFQ